MGTIGFNTGMSDQLQKIMERRMKEQQQQFENNLKLKADIREAEAHAADIELKKEQLESAKEVRKQAAGAHTQKSYGAGEQLPLDEAKKLDAAGLPVAGGHTLPSKSTFGFGTLPGSTAPAEASDTGEPAAMPQVIPAQGTMITKQSGGTNQLEQPTETYNPVTGSGAHVPTYNVGSPEQREEQAIKALALQPNLTDDELFQKLLRVMGDPVKAANATKALRPANTTATPETSFVAKGPDGKPVPNAAVSMQGGVFLVNGKPVPAGITIEKVAPMVDPTLAALRDANLDNAKNKRQDDSYNRATSTVDKLAVPVDAAELRITRLIDTLGNGNPQADAFIAAEAMVVMAGGQGSGVRINNAEITRVAGGQIMLTKLREYLNKWSLDPNKPQIPDEQRAQLLNLTELVNSKIRAKQEAINEVRAMLSDPDSSVEQHRKALADLHAKLSQIDQGAAPAAGTLTTKPKPAAAPVAPTGASNSNLDKLNARLAARGRK